MKSPACIHLLLISLLLVNGCFNLHLTNYSGEVGTTVQNDVVPFTHLHPLMVFDHHEDITLKPAGVLLPSPQEAHAGKQRTLPVTIPLCPSPALWQPPESNG